MGAYRSRTHQHAFSASHISDSVLFWPQYGAVCRILAVAIEFGPCFMDLVVRSINRTAILRPRTAALWSTSTYLSSRQLLYC